MIKKVKASGMHKDAERKCLLTFFKCKVRVSNMTGGPEALKDQDFEKARDIHRSSTGVCVL